VCGQPVEEIIIGYPGLSHHMYESSAMMGECADFDILLSSLISECIRSNAIRHFIQEKNT
jgi:hypothetical protein